MPEIAKEVIDPEITDLLKKAIEEGGEPFRYSNDILKYCPKHKKELVLEGPLHEINERYIAHKICPSCNSIYVTKPTEKDIAKYENDLRLGRNRF